MGIQNFDHSHHKLKIRGLKSPVDVLTLQATNSSAHPSATTFSLPAAIKPSRRNRC